MLVNEINGLQVRLAPFTIQLLLERAPASRAVASRLQLEPVLADRQRQRLDQKPNPSLPCSQGAPLPLSPTASQPQTTTTRQLSTLTEWALEIRARAKRMPRAFAAPFQRVGCNYIAIQLATPCSRGADHWRRAVAGVSGGPCAEPSRHATARPGARPGAPAGAGSGNPARI